MPQQAWKEALERESGTFDEAQMTWDTIVLIRPHIFHTT